MNIPAVASVPAADSEGMTLWASIKNSRKAIVAGLIALGTFITVTLQAHPGQDLTVRQWLEAALIYAAAHTTIWLVGNEDKPLAAPASVGIHDLPASAGPDDTDPVAPTPQKRSESVEGP